MWETHSQPLSPTAADTHRLDRTSPNHSLFCSFLPSFINRHSLSTCICQLLLGIGWILRDPWPQDPVESDRQKNNCKWSAMCSLETKECGNLERTTPELTVVVVGGGALQSRALNSIEVESCQKTGRLALLDKDLVLVCSACYIKNHSRCVVLEKKCISHNSGGWKVQHQSAGRFDVWWRPTSWFMFFHGRRGKGALWGLIFIRCAPIGH